MGRHCLPSSEPFLQSKPNQLRNLSTGQPSSLRPRQERLGAPASEQVQDKPVLMVPAAVHPLGLTCYVHLPEMVTCLHT